MGKNVGTHGLANPRGRRAEFSSLVPKLAASARAPPGKLGLRGETASAAAFSTPVALPVRGGAASFRAMSITVTVENDTIKLPPDVHVPDGTRVEITLPEEKSAAAPKENALAWMLEYAGIVDDMPADLAAEHDHYLYGTPKRGKKA